MNIYMIYQKQNRGYDTYDSAVVCAESEEEAQKIHPNGGELFEDEMYPTWATKISEVEVEYLGEARPNIEKGVILSSFNAG